jgi:hypothetical protein
MIAFDNTVLQMLVFEYVTLCQFVSASLLHLLRACTSYTIDILSRWESNWIWLLMLIIALLSVVALRFYSLRSPTAAASCKTSEARIQDNSNEAVAAGRSSTCVSGTNGAVSDNFGSFAEEFQNALRIKTAGDSAEAGKWHVVAFVESVSVVASFMHSILQKNCCENLWLELLLPKKPRFESNIPHILSRQRHFQALEELHNVTKLQGKSHECVIVLEELLQHLLACHGPRSIRTLKSKVRATCCKMCYIISNTIYLHVMLHVPSAVPSYDHLRSSWAVRIFAADASTRPRSPSEKRCLYCRIVIAQTIPPLWNACPACLLCSGKWRVWMRQTQFCWLLSKVQLVFTDLIILKLF